jgi:NAD(P)-dependent dehydrogenase (short-subunit alcohol dehydrogenase family)
VSALDGKRGAITGAAQGIGLAIAEAMIAAGASVMLLDRDPGVSTTAERLGAAGAHSVDVSDEDSVQAAFERLGSVDFLVNNAGVRTIAPLLDVELEDWRRTLAVNLDGTFLCTKAVLPGMLERGGGAIVNIASVAGILAFKNRPAYNVSKAGIIAFTKSVAQELSGRGIRCNAIAPGVVETPLTAAYFEDDAFAAGIRANTATGQWGQPNDIADPVVFLCSDAARFVSGETLVVDGGWCAGKGY